MRRHAAGRVHLNAVAAVIGNDVAAVITRAGGGSETADNVAVARCDANAIAAICKRSCAVNGNADKIALNEIAVRGTYRNPATAVAGD